MFQSWKTFRTFSISRGKQALPSWIQTGHWVRKWRGRGDGEMHVIYLMQVNYKSWEANHKDAAVIFVSTAAPGRYAHGQRTDAKKTE